MTNNSVSQLRHCAFCGGEFTSRKSSHLYCSKLCRGRAKTLRAKLKGHVYLKVGRVYLHRLIYVSAFGEEALLDGFDVHHLDNNPLNNNHENLLAIPHNLHARIRHLVKKGHKIGRLLFPFHILRARLYYRNNPHFEVGGAV
jgi:recombinational DNA repair protein (RecF pathway)